MTYTFTSPDEQSGQSWQTITLSLPPDSPIAVPAGRWERRDGHIVATYTPEELKLAVVVALQQQQVELEAQLERELERLDAAGDATEADRLLAGWDALNAVLDRTVATIRNLEFETTGGCDGA